MSPAEEQMHASPELRRTVLLVEDEVLLRMVLSDELRVRGFNVVEAASGDEARKLVLAGIEFDLVLSDITMPGELDGADLARWLCDNEVNAPVIFTSGLPTALDRAREIYDHDDVLAQVETALKSRE